MAVAFRSASGTTYASRTNNVVTAPAGIQNNDVLLLICSTAAATTAPTATPPTGFTAVPGPTFPLSLLDSTNFNVRTWVWSKVASGESGSYTITHAACTSQAWMGCYSGGDTANPITPNATQNTAAAGPTATATGVTTTVNSSAIVFMCQDWGTTVNNLTTPAGTTPTFTKRFGVTANAGVLYVADGILATAGATGNKTLTTNSTINDRWGAWLVPIQAAAAAGDVFFGQVWL